MAHTDDNLIEARLRQLEARTSFVGGQPSPVADAFWHEKPIITTAAAPASANQNRWLGPILGIVVGSVVTQLITALGSSQTQAPTTQVAVAAAPTTETTATPSDPTTQALSRLIAAKPAAVTPPATPVRAIDAAEIVKLQQTRKLSVGRQDPFAVIAPAAPPMIQPAGLPRMQVIVPEPPAGPAPTPEPKPTSQIRFNGSFAADGTYTALIEETAQGQTTMRRWHLGETVLGGYRVVEIGLRTLKLRWGGETVMLSVGSSQTLERRAGGSGLSAIAPEPAETATGIRPAVWRPAPAASTRLLSTPLASPFSTPLATPVPAVMAPEVPSPPAALAVEAPAVSPEPPGDDAPADKTAPTRMPQ